MLSLFESSWPTGNHKLTFSPGCLLHAYLPSIRFVFIVAPEVLNRNSTIDQMIDVVIYALVGKGSHFLESGKFVSSLKAGIVDICCVVEGLTTVRD